MRGAEEHGAARLRASRIIAGAMQMRWARLEARDVAAAAATSLPFAAYLVVAGVHSPPTEGAWRRADPILKLLPRGAAIGLVVVAALVAIASWTVRARPGRRELVRAAGEGVAGAVAAVVVLVALRAMHGPSMPRFVPAEESAAPGVALNMAAGLGEEVVFRLGILSALFFALASKLRRATAAVLAAVVTGVAFAVAHALGPDPSSAAWFVTRFAVPGFAMSLAYLGLGPSFIVVAHCTAHLLIPRLFS